MQVRFLPRVQSNIIGDLREVNNKTTCEIQDGYCIAVVESQLELRRDIWLVSVDAKFNTMSLNWKYTRLLRMSNKHKIWRLLDVSFQFPPAPLLTEIMDKASVLVRQKHGENFNALDQKIWNRLISK